MKKFILYLAAAFCFMLISNSAFAQRPVITYNTPDTLFVDTVYSTANGNALTPTNTGGGGITSYAITGTLPTGMTFSTTTGIISGTPTATMASTTYTITATNASGTSLGTNNLRIVVLALPPPVISYTTPDSYFVGVAVSLAPTNSNTGITTGYTLTSGVLPAGLTFNTATGIISGTTTTITATVTLDIFVNNSTGLSSGTTVTITVTASPPIISYAGSPATLTQGTAMTALTPTNTGGTVATAGAVYGAGTTILSGLGGAYGMATDASGNVYVTNSTGNSVTEYSTTGVTTATAVIAGTPVGIVFDAAGDAFVLEQASNSVVEYVGGLSGSATTIITGLSTPTGIAIDATGNLYIANSGNNTITKYTVTTWALSLTITTNAGGFFNNRVVSGGIAVDASGNIYVVDNRAGFGRGGSEVDVYSSAGVYSRRYRQGRTNSAISLDASGNIYLTSLGRLTATAYTANFAGVTATEGGFSSPRGIVTDATGNLYVSDYTKGTVTKYPRVIGYVLTGTLPPGLSFNTTTGVISGTPQTTFPSTTYTITAYNAGGSGSTTVTISCLGNPPVISYTTPDVYGIGAVISLSPTLSGGALIPTGYGAGTALSGAALNAPWGMTKDASGNIWVVNNGNSTVSEFGPTGAFIKNVTITGTAGTLTGIAIDAAGNMYFSSTNGRVYKATTAGAAVQYANPNFGASLYGIAIDASGVVYTTDEANGNVYKITAANTVSRPVAKPIGGITNPTGIAVDAAGDIYVVDATSKTLVEYNAAGAFVRTVATGLTQPFGLYLDASGDAYVSDNSDGTVKEFNSNGTLVATLTGIAGQRGLTVDASGNLYVSDFTANSVTKYPPTYYTLSGATLPTGITFNTTTGLFSGTTTATFGPLIFTVTVYGSGGSGTTQVTITCTNGPVFSYTTPDTYTQGVAISPNLTPTITSGGPITGYAVTGTPLPTGLTLNTSTGVISGTPTVLSPATNYTITGTNATGSTAVIINITVLLGKPVITYPSPQTYVTGVAITALNPTNTGGAAVSYAISGTPLPAGLTLNTSTGVISGTPTTPTAVFAYTVTATNAAGTNSCTVTITIVSNPVFTYTTPDVYTVGTLITTLSPANTGSTPTSYSINTPLPAGLNFNTANGQITGTPTAVSAGANYIVTGTDALGHTGTFTINITVNDVPPTISYTSPNIYTVGTTITPLVPTVTGIGAAPTNYVISGLPAGLSIDPLTGIISGTPSAAAALAVYTVTATNDGGNGTFPITITVKALGPVIAYTTPNIFPINTAIAPLTPVNSGSTPTSYAIAGGALPTGLSFSTVTGVISGTPTVVTAATIYTITATDGSGNTGQALVTISCAAYVDWIGATSTAWNVGTNWATGTVPGATDVAGIGVNQTFKNQPIVTAAASVGAIVIGTSSTVVNVPTVTTPTAVVLTVTGVTLTVSGTITSQSDANSSAALGATISGTGTVIASGINVNATTVHAAAYTQTLTSSVTSLKLSSDIVLTSTKPGAVAFDATFNITGGTVLLTGKVQTTNASGNTSTIAILPTTTATLQLANVAAFSGLSATAGGTNNLNFDNTGATVEYSGASQTVYTNSAAVTGLPSGISNNYYSLKFSGTGIKTPNGTNADYIEVDGNFTNSLPTVDAFNYIDLSLPTVYFGGTTQSIFAGQGTTFYNVQFFGSGTTTVVSGFAFVASSGVLTMYAPAILASGGNLTLNSDASGSATVAAIPTGSSITGDVNVERFITGGAGHRGYRLLSSQVTIGATGFESLNYLINSCYIKGTTGVPGGFDQVGNPNIYLYRENIVPSNASFISGNFRGINTLGTSFTNVNYLVDGDAGTWNIPKGDGFMFFFRGDRSVASIAVEQGLAYVPTSTTLVATGTLNQGAITVHDWYTPASATLGYTTTVTASGNNSTVRGFNLVGNPYASSIDFDTYGTSAGAGIYTPGGGVGPYAYIFDPVSQNYSIYTAGTGGVGTIATVNANIIPSGQGFFVAARAAGTSLTFNEAAKVNTQAIAADGNLFLGTPKQNAIAQSLHIRLTRDSITSKVNTDGIFFIFEKSASTKYVPIEDAPYKAGSGTVGLTSKSSDNFSLAVNRMPFPTVETQKIPLTVTGNKTGIYQLTMTLSKSIPLLYTMWLKDAYKQDSLDIRANPTYSFNIDKSDTSSFGANRFSLVMSENPALMVHLLNFNATKTKGGSQVVWKTENEQNYTNFTVERSTDGGVTFAVLGGYASSALGTYSFLDQNPAMKANQYRLKLQDLNGTISYSKVVTLMYGNGDSPLTAHINIFPNPSADVINVSIPSSTVTNTQTNLSGLQTLATTPGLVSTNSGSSSSYDIKIISITGSVIKSATSASTNWQGSVSGLAPGTYIIQVINNSDKSLVGRNTFVKL